MALTPSEYVRKYGNASVVWPGGDVHVKFEACGPMPFAFYGAMHNTVTVNTDSVIFIKAINYAAAEIGACCPDAKTTATAAVYAVTEALRYELTGMMNNIAANALERDTPVQISEKVIRLLFETATPDAVVEAVRAAAKAFHSGNHTIPNLIEKAEGDIAKARKRAA